MMALRNVDLAIAGQQADQQAGSAMGALGS